MTDEAPKRLRALGRETPRGLDGAARERVLARVRADGPGLVRRARRAQIATWVGAASVLALAAAALLVWVTGSGPSEGPELAEHPRRAAPREAPLAPRRAPAPAVRRCSAFASPVAQRSGPNDGGRVLITLGSLATAATTTPAAVRSEQPSPCVTLFVLATGGSIAVNARDLGGGELRVSTPAGAVVVHGTVFEVRATESGAELAVVEGVVAVARDGRELARIAAGGHASWRAGADDVEQAELADVDRDRIRGLLELGSPTVAPAVRRPAARSPDELVLAAERARHAGQLDDARRLFREAAALGGPVGESAWIKLARLEEGLGRLDAARRALASRAAQFPSGDLGPEATWLEHALAERAGDAAASRTSAQQIVDRWPASPYSAYARRWLRTNPEGSR